MFCSAGNLEGGNLPGLDPKFVARTLAEQGMILRINDGFHTLRSITGRISVSLSLPPAFFRGTTMTPEIAKRLALAYPELSTSHYGRSGRSGVADNSSGVVDATHYAQKRLEIRPLRPLRHGIDDRETRKRTRSR